MSTYIPLIIAAVALILVGVLFKLMWRVAEPNEAMIISGLKEGDHGFRIVTGKGTLVIPFVQTVRTLKLNLHETNLEVSCVTKQGIPVVVKGVVIYKVADDNPSIANAARRFLGQQQLMDGQVHNVFAGHMRSIIGSLTVEALITDRDALELQTRNTSATEMQTLGLLLDSLKIQEIDDPTSYIKHLAAPHIAEVEKSARVAEATNNREAAQAEQEAQAQIADAQRDTQIKQASYAADVQKAQAEAAQAGPLAEARAQAAVVEQQTNVAELRAKQTDKELDATVRKPADAENYRRVKEAEASRQAAILAAEADAQRVKLAAEAQAEQTQKVGEAEGLAIAAKGEAEGRALRAKAEGLAANNEAVIGQQLAGQAVEIVKAAASAFDNVGQMTVLNGSEGLMESLSTVVAQSLGTLKTIRSAMGTNGSEEMTPEAIGLGRPTR